MKAVYMIKNKINQKVYIGVSKNPERRFLEHCHKREKSVSLINTAIQKWGKDNFSLEILEDLCEDWAEKEIHYIQIMNSLVPSGYNIHPGGNTPPHKSGEQNPFCKITEEIAVAVKKDLLNPTVLRKDIVKKYQITYDILRHINEGGSWYEEGLSYPLRDLEVVLNKERADKVKHLLKTTTLTQRKIGELVGWKRSAVTMINIGKNHYDPNEKYPIRP